MKRSPLQHTQHIFLAEFHHCIMHHRQNDLPCTCGRLNSCVLSTRKASYLWITVLREDLQHRRFSALNISNQHQFTSHHQRLCTPPFLHFSNGTPGFSIKSQRKITSAPRECSQCREESVPVSVCPRRKPAVDLIEFATAALYTEGLQPIGAGHSTGFITSRYSTQLCSQRAKTQI